MFIVRAGLIPRVIALGSLAAFASHASIVTYSDRTLWLGQVTGVTTAVFEDAPAGGAINYQTSAGLTTAAMQFIGYTMTPPTYGMTMVKASGSQPWYNWGSGGLLRSESKDAAFLPYIHINMPVGGVTAWGVELMTGGPTPQLSVTVQIPGETPIAVQTAANPSRVFFGFVSTTPVLSVDVIGPNVQWTYFMMDNVSHATAVTATATPEPETWALAGIGVAFMLLGTRHRRRRQIDNLRSAA